MPGLASYGVPVPEIVDYFYKGIYYHTWFESLEAIAVTKSGSGDATIEHLGIIMSTGSTINSMVAIAKSPDYPMTIGTWDKKRRFKTRLGILRNTAQAAWILCGHDIGGNVKKVGFKVVDDELFGIVNDGTGDVTTFLQKIVALGNYLLEAIFVPGVSASFYVDDTLKGQITTHLPSGTDESARVIAFRIENREAANKEMYFTEYKFLQEP